MIYNKNRCAELIPLISHAEAIDGFRAFISEQISHVRTQLCKSSSWEQTLRLQGNYEILEQLLTLKESVKLTLKGSQS